MELRLINEVKQMASGIASVERPAPVVIASMAKEPILATEESQDEVAAYQEQLLIKRRLEYANLFFAIGVNILMLIFLFRALNRQ